jgi:hypothetical protein
LTAPIDLLMINSLLTRFALLKAKDNTCPKTYLNQKWGRNQELLMDDGNN